MNFRSYNVLHLGLAGGAIGILVGIFALVRTHAYTSGFSGSDEPAHFLNAYLISTYIQHWFGTNPLKFATDFYIHYPKITIGHWPPAYYGLVGLLYLIIPATTQSAFLINLFIAALPSAGIAIALGKLVDKRTAIIGAAVYSFTPLVWEGQTFFMLDQALAACCIAATFAWLRFTTRPGWTNALVFSLLCTFAVLLKGNGWLLALMPLYYVLLTSRYDLLLNKYLYGAASIAVLIVVPWYLATAGISADGFNYKAGWSYAWLALTSNFSAFGANLSMLCFMLVLIALGVEFRARNVNAIRWSYISACLSLILATLTLQSVVPVDIVDRYIAPALPPFLVLTMIGLIHFNEFVKMKVGRTMAYIISAIFLSVMLAPGLMHIVKRHPKPDYRMSEVADFEKQLASGIWLIDGSPNIEGAFIAEMAIRDQSLSNYVVRASKLLAVSNFMGSNYRLRFSNEDEVLHEIARLGIKSIVIAGNKDQPAFAHSELLLRALEKPNSNYAKKASFEFRVVRGRVDVYEAITKVLPNFEAVRKDGLPSKASKIVDSFP